MGLVYGWHNKVDKRWYVGQTIRSAAERRAEHMDSLSWQSAELYGDMLRLGMDQFEFIVLEDNLTPGWELNAREAYWIGEKKADYNGGCTGEYKYGDPAIAATFPVTTSLGKTYSPFLVNKSHVGQLVIYRWAEPTSSLLTKKDKADDILRRERIGIIHEVKRTQVAIRPIAPMSRYPVEWIKVENVFGLAPEKV